MGLCASKGGVDEERLGQLQLTLDNVNKNLASLQNQLRTTATNEDVARLGAMVDRNAAATEQTLQILDEAGRKGDEVKAAVDELLQVQSEAHVQSTTIHEDVVDLQEGLLKVTEKIASLEPLHLDTQAQLSAVRGDITDGISTATSILVKLDTHGVTLADDSAAAIDTSVAAVSHQASQVLSELFSCQRHLDKLNTTLERVAVHAAEAASFQQVSDLASDLLSLQPTTPPLSPHHPTSAAAPHAAKPPAATPSTAGWSRTHRDLLTRTAATLDLSRPEISAAATGLINLRDWSSDRTHYNADHTSSWVFSVGGASKATLTFSLKGELPYSFALVLTHLTAFDHEGNRPGHAPIKVTINDTLVVQSHSVPSWDYLTERWLIPKGILLPRGWENKVVLELVAGATSAYWLQRLEIRPHCVYGQPHLH